MHNKAPWPFTDRDFVETRFVRKRDNGDIEIYFRSSCNQDFPESSYGVIRGETILGAQIFRKKVSSVTGKVTLFVTTICQADMKGEIPKKALGITLPFSVLKWFNSVKKQLNVRKNNIFNGC